MLSVIQIPSRSEDFHGHPFDLAPGTRVSLRRPGPPWLVINHQLERIIVSQWPIRLWTVTDVETVEEPADYQVTSWYTRATSCVVVAEIPAWRVFGPHGEEVAGIIERAAGLSPTYAESLAQGRREEAGPLYALAWQRWLGNEARPGTREVPPTGWNSESAGSPVGNGLGLAGATVEGAARRVGAELFAFDEHDGIDVLADPIWVAARRAAGEAVLGLGAPDLFTPEERQTMLTGWLSSAGPGDQASAQGS